MDFLENVRNAAQSAAQNVMKKSGEVVEYSKIKYAMFDVNNSIKELKSQIGQAVYESYKNDTPLDEIVKEKCEQISRLEARIEEYKEQLDNCRSALKCPACGRSLKEDCSFCPYCGEKLAEEKDAEVHAYYTPAGAGTDDTAADETKDGTAADDTAE